MDFKNENNEGSREGRAKIRQSFSHGRSKVVTVEVKKKRTFNKPNGLSSGKKEQLMSGTEILVKKSGLTNVELEKRIKAVQERALVQRLEAKQRQDSADDVLNYKIAEVEAKRQEKELAESKTAEIEKLAAQVEAVEAKKSKSGSDKSVFDTKKNENSKASFTCWA